MNSDIINQLAITNYMTTEHFIYFCLILVVSFQEFQQINF